MWIEVKYVPKRRPFHNAMGKRPSWWLTLTGSSLLSCHCAPLQIQDTERKGSALHVRMTQIRFKRTTLGMGFRGGGVKLARTVS